MWSYIAGSLKIHKMELLDQNMRSCNQADINIKCCKIEGPLYSYCAQSHRVGVIIEFNVQTKLQTCRDKLIEHVHLNFNLISQFFAKAGYNPMV